MRFLLLTTFSLLLAMTTPASAGLPVADSQGEKLPTLAPMLEQTIPAVVNIFTETRVPAKQNPLFSDPLFRHFFNVPQPQEQVTRSLGSGVVVDAENGIVITNTHVIENATEIAVNLHDGRSLKAKLVGSDPESDVAVIQVEAENLTALPLADSDKLAVGDFVVAIGNPFGLGQTVTSGIVSALGRSGLGIEGYEDFIQTDASINPGNSGGALVNLRGELVGINTAILSKSGGNVGIGFSIPINMVESIMAQLLEFGEVRRGTLGASAQDLNPELAAAFGLDRHNGAVVTQVTPGSPADRAGLRAGDIITRINNRPVDNSSDVRNRIGLLRVGEKVAITVLRDGDKVELEAKVEAPEPVVLEGEKIHPKLKGATLASIVEGSPLYGKIEGIIVADIEGYSSAYRAGLRKGDIITQANRRAISDINGFREAIKGSDALLLNIQRRSGALFLLIR